MALKENNTVMEQINNNTVQQILYQGISIHVKCLQNTGLLGGGVYLSTHMLQLSYPVRGIVLQH